MKRLITFAALSFCLVAVLVSVSAPLAFAATPPPPAAGSGQALEIAPPLITLTANPGQTIQAQIKLRDIAKNDLLVTNQVNDFVANGEDGTPKILTDTDQTSPFSVKDWITTIPSLLLKPQEIKTLNIAINVPTNASPGGHYGVIRFTGTPPKLNGTGVSLSASLGALVLLTVSGKLHHDLSVQEFSVNDGGKAGSFFQSAPLTFVTRLHNTGNVQEEPSGHIIITDMFGKTIAGLNVNLPPRNILPDSIRKFESKLDKNVIGHKRLFGRYHATLTLNYGDNNKQTVTASITFWVIPWHLILGVIIALIAGFFLLRFLIRRYNRRIISRVQNAQSRQSQPSKRKKK
jgi:hypothetical protein